MFTRGPAYFVAFLSGLAALLYQVIWHRLLVLLTGADAASTTVRPALAEGTAGYMIRMPEGDVPTDRCEVWPVRVSALNDSAITSANEAKTFMVTFAVTSEPNKNAVIPAA